MLTEEMSFHISFESSQGFCILDDDGQIIAECSKSDLIRICHIF